MCLQWYKCLNQSAKQFDCWREKKNDCGFKIWIHLIGRYKHLDMRIKDSDLQRFRFILFWFQYYLMNMHNKAFGCHRLLFSSFVQNICENYVMNLAMENYKRTTYIGHRIFRIIQNNVIINRITALFCWASVDIDLI